MAGGMEWKPLPSGPRGLSLLYKADIPASKSSESDQGYRIYITDLSRIWGEQLSKNDIHRRASETACSIDPSEDDHQYIILLSKIRSALDHETDTSVQLSKHPKAEPALLLTLTAPLPAPLPKLKWTVNLASLTQDTLGFDLVLPLVHQTLSLQRKLDHLVQIIHDKDRIISKITDRLETSGNDLTTVFPGVSNIKTNRKRSQRAQLAAHVKGLGDFDGDEIQDAQAPGSGTVLSNGTMNAIITHLPLERNSGRSNGICKHWWEKLPCRPEQTKGLFEDDRQRGDSDEEMEENDDRNVPSPRDVRVDADDDDFQRQATPPQLVTHKGGQDKDHGLFVSQQSDAPVQDEKNDKDGESSTDEDDDLDAPRPKARTREAPKLSVASSLPHRQNGTDTLEQFSSQTAKPSTDTSPSSKPRSKLGTFGAKRKAVPTIEEPLRERSTTQTKPIAKLGTFGGKGKPQKHHSREGTPMSDGPSRETAALPSPSKARLGTIGGSKTQPSETHTPMPLKPVSAAVETAKEESPSGSRKSDRESTPALRETSQDRADRKRDQLKRELEAKAKAPAKKKRKF